MARVDTVEPAQSQLRLLRIAADDGVQRGDEPLRQQRVRGALECGGQLGEVLGGGGPGVEGRDLPGGRDREPGQRLDVVLRGLRGDAPDLVQPLRRLGDGAVACQQVGQQRFEAGDVRGGGPGPAAQGPQERLGRLLGAGSPRDDQQVGQVFVAQRRRAASSQAL